MTLYNVGSAVLTLAWTSFVTTLLPAPTTPPVCIELSTLPTGVGTPVCTPSVRLDCAGGDAPINSPLLCWISLSRLVSPYCSLGLCMIWSKSVSPIVATICGSSSAGPSQTWVNVKQAVWSWLSGCTFCPVFNWLVHSCNWLSSTNPDSSSCSSNYLASKSFTRFVVSLVGLLLGLNGANFSISSGMVLPASRQAYKRRSLTSFLY